MNTNIYECLKNRKIYYCAKKGKVTYDDCFFCHRKHKYERSRKLCLDKYGVKKHEGEHYPYYEAEVL